MALLAASCGLAAIGCGGGGGGGATPPSPISGVVIGSYFRNAKVCADTNNNGACDAGEATAITGSSGQFTLVSVPGAVVAEIGTDAVAYDIDTNATAPVRSRIVLRAPREAPGVVSVHSTAVASEMESASLPYESAVQKVAATLGVSTTQLMSDFNKESDAAAKAKLRSASTEGLTRIQLALAGAKPTDDVRKILASATGTLEKIKSVVVVYLENRSFNNLYGLFPGARGISDALANPTSYRQLDRDGVTVLPRLPAVWGAGAAPDWAFVAALPNAPFRIDAPPGGVPGFGLSVITPDLLHRFYQNQMQANGGKNNLFAAWSDGGGLAMGYYDGSAMKLWKLAQQYVLADAFFQAAHGGSYLNHFWLVCACTPIGPNTPPGGLVAAVDSSGTRLTLAPGSPASSLAGPPLFLGDGNLTPLQPDGKHYSINTTQPAYQPSFTPPAPGGDPRLADPSGGGLAPWIPLPPQTMTTIGDTLTNKGVDWKWYAGGWNRALVDRSAIADGTFEPHHNPFLYFRAFDPTTTTGAAQRATHLKDYADLLADIQNGSLPAVTFYKPPGPLTQHPGETDIASGDAHVADLVTRLQASPQWRNMLIVVTYDENGGFWDHAAPPKGDAWGPGTRIPTIVISPYAKKGYVDSVTYDTTSILKLITRRFGLEPLPGVRTMVSDLSNALDLSQ